MEWLRSVQQGWRESGGIGAANETETVCNNYRGSRAKEEKKGKGEGRNGRATGEGVRRDRERSVSADRKRKRRGRKERRAARDDEKFDRTQRAHCTVVHPLRLPPPLRPIHPIIPPALYDQSILFYTASHETSRPDGSTVPILVLFLFLSFPSAIADAACLRLLFTHHFSTMPRNSFVHVGFSFPIEHPGRSSSPSGRAARFLLARLREKCSQSERRFVSARSNGGGSFENEFLCARRGPPPRSFLLWHFLVPWFCIREYIFRLRSLTLLFPRNGVYIGGYVYLFYVLQHKNRIFIWHWYCMKVEY